MSAIASFPPVAAADARILILGSIPGKESLRQQQYYAHPRNLFWRIIGELFDCGLDRPYPERLKALTANRIALWDVIGACLRPSSLDSDIDETSIKVNDFRHFLDVHPHIEVLLFNGGKAEQTFKRHVLPALDTKKHPLLFLRLPSTSPANAGCSYGEKLAAWRAALAPEKSSSTATPTMKNRTN
jgi:TDG/mug DNA glycosylase family protein